MSQTTTEPTFAKGDPMATIIIREAVSAAGLPERFEETVAQGLGAKFTEADVLQHVRVVQRTVEAFEKKDMMPKVPHRVTESAGTVRVGDEHADKVIARLEATFRGDYMAGFGTISEAYAEVTGRFEPMSDARATTMMSDLAAGARSYNPRLTESLNTSSWGEVVADVMNRRTTELYEGGMWSDWKKIARTAPVTDFRTQRLIQVSEFANLPTVNEGAPYQPLTSPVDLQATYAVTKKGGTEDFTYEMMKNDDIRALVGIPDRLARVANWTLYTTVFGVLSGNPTLTTDSTALFHTDHANTTAVALTQAGLTTVRRKMRDQAAYGDTSRATGLTPKFLVVPNELEEVAFKLTTSKVAVPAASEVSNTPNVHEGMEHIVCDWFTDADDWYAVCDPAQHPTIEVGFMDGRETPELFLNDGFTTDRQTWKLRHVWGYAVVDYRGFQRGTQ